MGIHCSDCLEHLKTLADNSVDSLVTDPPAGISFMGKEWDHHKGGRNEWIGWMESVMRECLRVLKPGAHGLVWAIPRTSHWTATALENAGFEVRDVVTHLFGSGFPKSHNVGKKTGIKDYEGIGTALKPASEHWILVRKRPIQSECEEIVLSVVPNTQLTTLGLKKGLESLARMLAGSGVPHEQQEKALQLGRAVNGLDPTAMSLLVQLVGSIDLNTVSSWKKISDADLERVKTFITLMASRQTIESKTSNCFQPQITPNATILDQKAFVPDANHIILIRKPLSEKTVASNVIKYGTGGINVDASRIDLKEGETTHGGGANQGGEIYSGEGSGFNNIRKGVPNIKSTQGRFPANLVLSHSEFCEDDRCDMFCPIAMLDAQSGVLKSGLPGIRRNDHRSHAMSKVFKITGRREVGFGDTGGASRFFYCAKTSKSERGVGNVHPTVKPQKLMQYLIRMITPPNGTVLDPFMGSGSTGVAAKSLGFKFIGIEREKEYFEIAEKRIGSF